MLGGHGSEVRLHAIFGRTQQDGRPTLEAVRAGTKTGTDGGQLAVDDVHGNRALRHVDELRAAAEGEEADGPEITVLGLLEMRRDLRAVVPNLRRGEAFVDREDEGSHVLEQLADLAGLPSQLFLISQVLVLAAAALTEERTAGHDPIRRGGQHLHQVRMRAVLVVPKNAGLHDFLRQGERHKDHPAIDAADTRAEIGERFDGELDFLMIGKRCGDKLLRRTGKHGGRRACAASLRRATDFTGRQV